MKLSMLLPSLILTSFWSGRVDAQVSFDRLKNAKQEPHNWLTYSGDYAGQRYSALAQINRENVQHLAVQWIFQTGTAGPFECTPLVIDGIMYVSGLNNRVYALDAVSGRLIWRYERALPEKISLCCGRVNRGVAALGNKIFLATLDAYVVALDAKTGNVIWEVKAADYQRAETFTLAPLAVKDKIIVGIAGGDLGNRGFIDAYEAESGKRVWRFYTVPAPGEPGNETWEGDSWKTGGGPAWVTGTYDPLLNLIFWGTGNPGSALYGKDRKATTSTQTVWWHSMQTPGS